MNNYAWNMKRVRLEDNLTNAAVKLLAHTGAASAMVPVAETSPPLSVQVGTVTEHTDAFFALTDARSRVVELEGEVEKLKQENQTLRNVRGVLWLDVAIRDKRIAELEVQTAAQARQPKLSEEEVFKLFKQNCVHYAGNYEVSPGQALRIANKLHTPPVPANSLAIVQAALDAAAKFCFDLQLPNPDKSLEVDNYNRGCKLKAMGIRALNKQAIIDSVNGKQDDQAASTDI